VTNAVLHRWLNEQWSEILVEMEKTFLPTHPPRIVLALNILAGHRSCALVAWFSTTISVSRAGSGRPASHDSAGHH
jgi:hypothetical protein